jgi:hypothetical protein
LVRRLPMIGIGDLRKVMLSMIDRAALAAPLRGGGAGAEDPPAGVHPSLWRPGAAAARNCAIRCACWSPALRRACAPALRAALAGLTAGMGRPGGRLRVPGHCLGNLLLTAAVFRGARGPGKRAVGSRAGGGDADGGGAIGVPAGRVHAATATPGTLIYEYANGVVATGQVARGAGAARVRRAAVRISFAGAAAGQSEAAGAAARSRSDRLCAGQPLQQHAAGAADAGGGRGHPGEPARGQDPGRESLDPGRRNGHVVPRESRGFWVSELIEAYGRNVPGGIAGLFDVALATSLDTVPGSIIRNYALEDKHPIHLDRARVAALGVMPVEASLFSNDRWQRDAMIHHDPARFAAAVRTVYEGWASRRRGRGRARAGSRLGREAGAAGAVGTLGLRAHGCGLRRIGAQVDPARHRCGRAVEDFLWESPDVRPEQLAYFDGVRVVAESLAAQPGVGQRAGVLRSGDAATHAA